MPTRPGHLRDAFTTAVDVNWPPDAEAVEFHDPTQQARWETMTPDQRADWLTGQLWHCSDIMPSDTCSELALPPGSTYARAARLLRMTHGVARVHTPEPLWRLLVFMVLGAAGVGGVVLASLLLVNIGLGLWAPSRPFPTPPTASTTTAQSTANAPAPVALAPPPEPTPKLGEQGQVTVVSDSNAVQSLPTVAPSLTRLTSENVSVVAGTQGQGLVVRDAPNGRKLGLIPEGGQVQVTQRTTAEWWRVHGNGFDGYVASTYLSGPLETAAPAFAKLSH